MVTFDEMRAQLRSQTQGRQTAGKEKGRRTQVKITPKIAITYGDGSGQILNYTAKEMKTRVDMEMQGQD